MTTFRSSSPVTPSSERDRAPISRGEDAADVFMSGPILASTAAAPDTDALA